MGYEPFEPVLKAPVSLTSGAELDRAAARDHPVWRAPVVTTLGLDRTLFSTGSPNDFGGSGSTGG
jgi:hypothetical protein